MRSQTNTDDQERKSGDKLVNDKKTQQSKKHGFLEDFRLLASNLPATRSPPLFSMFSPFSEVETKNLVVLLRLCVEKEIEAAKQLIRIVFDADSSSFCNRKVPTRQAHHPLFLHWGNSSVCTSQLCSLDCSATFGPPRWVGEMAWPPSALNNGGHLEPRYAYSSASSHGSSFRGFRSAGKKQQLAPAHDGFLSARGTSSGGFVVTFRLTRKLVHGCFVGKKGGALQWRGNDLERNQAELNDEIRIDTITSHFDAVFTLGYFKGEIGCFFSPSSAHSGGAANTFNASGVSGRSDEHSEAHTAEVSALVEGMEVVTVFTNGQNLDKGGLNIPGQLNDAIGQRLVLSILKGRGHPSGELKHLPKMGGSASKAEGPTPFILDLAHLLMLWSLLEIDGESFLSESASASLAMSEHGKSDLVAGSTPNALNLRDQGSAGRPMHSSYYTSEAVQEERIHSQQKTAERPPLSRLKTKTGESLRGEIVQSRLRLVFPSHAAGDLSRRSAHPSSSSMQQTSSLYHLPESSAQRTSTPYLSISPRSKPPTRARGACFLPCGGVLHWRLGNQRTAYDSSAFDGLALGGKSSTLSDTMKPRSEADELCSMAETRTPCDEHPSKRDDQVRVQRIDWCKELRAFYDCEESTKSYFFTTTRWHYAEPLPSMVRPRLVLLNFTSQKNLSHGKRTEDDREDKKELYRIWGRIQNFRSASPFAGESVDHRTTHSLAAAWRKYVHLFIEGNPAKALRDTAKQCCRRLQLREEEEILKVLAKLTQGYGKNRGEGHATDIKSCVPASASFSEMARLNKESKWASTEGNGTLNYLESFTSHLFWSHLLAPVLEETIKTFQCRRMPFLSGVVLCNVILPAILRGKRAERSERVPPIPLPFHPLTAESCGKVYSSSDMPFMFRGGGWGSSSFGGSALLSAASEGVKVGSGSSANSHTCAVTSGGAPTSSPEETDAATAGIQFPEAPVAHWIPSFLGVCYVERVARVVESVSKQYWGENSDLQSLEIGEARVVRRVLEQYLLCGAHSLKIWRADDYLRGSIRPLATNAQGDSKCSRNDEKENSDGCFCTPMSDEESTLLIQLPSIVSCAVCGKSLAENRFDTAAGVPLGERAHLVCSDQKREDRLSSVKDDQRRQGCLFVQCTLCGHGGHVEHIVQWWKDKGVSKSCPSGCGCLCCY